MKATASETWAKRLAEWKTSGQSMEEYARETGVNPRTLGFWRWKLSRTTRERRKERPEKPSGRPKNERRRNSRSVATIEASAFVELVPASKHENEDGFVVDLRSGHRLRVPMRFEERSLGSLLKALEVQ